MPKKNQPLSNEKIDKKSQSITNIHDVNETINTNGIMFGYIQAGKTHAVIKHMESLVQLSQKKGTRSKVNL